MAVFAAAAAMDKVKRTDTIPQIASIVTKVIIRSDTKHRRCQGSKGDESGVMPGLVQNSHVADVEFLEMIE